MEPLVSIVLPTYNGEKYLKKAIESIIKQTYKNWELIIINDCSTDSTVDIIKEYLKKDNRISLYSNEKNLKIPKSLNKGFGYAKGKFYTWASDDNIYKPNAFEVLVNYLITHPEVDLVSSRADLIDADGKIFKIFDKNNKRNLIRFTRGCNIGGCFMYRSEIAKKIGKYDEKLYCAEDYDFWCRIFINGNIAYIPDNLYQYRYHSKMTSIKKENQMRDKELMIRMKYMKLFFKKLKLTKKEQIENLFSFFYRENLNIKWLIMALEIDSRLFLLEMLRNTFKNILIIFKKQKKRSYELCEKFYELNIRRYGDDRGFLTTIEGNKDIPFEIKRVYYLSEVSKNKERAHHAHKRSKRVLSAIQGSVEAHLFDGKNKRTFFLDDPTKAIYFDNKVWCELVNFKDNAIVLALASEEYDEKEYIRNYDEYLKYIGEEK